MEAWSDLLAHQFRAYAAFEEVLDTLVQTMFFSRGNRRREIKAGSELYPVNVMRTRFLPPVSTEEACYAKQSPYRRRIILELIVGEFTYSGILLGVVPALTSRGTLLFGREPVRERVAVIQLLPKPEVWLARIVAPNETYRKQEDEQAGKRRSGLSEKRKQEILDKYNKDHGTSWTREKLKTIDQSADLKNYSTSTLGDLLQSSVRFALRRICDYFWSNPVASLEEIETFLFLCLPQMFTTLVEQFLVRSGLVQVLDKTNPLAEVAHKRKVTFCGRRGLRNLYSDDIKERQVDDSQRGRLCPVETPESMRIGLNLCLALGAMVEGGKLEGIETDHPANMLGASVGLIPFVEHDDMNRAMMGAKNMKQALPLIYSEPPLVKTGLETRVGLESRLCIIAEKDGRLLHVDQDTIQVQYDGEDQLRSYQLPIIPGAYPGLGSFYRVFDSGPRCVKRGDVLADSAATVNGELTLGVNLLVAYMPWYGYNFEDAIVVNRRLVTKNVLTSLHVEKSKDGSLTLVRRPLTVGDKLTGRHGNKGVVSLILAPEKMPHLADGTPIDVLLNPHGVISRMNIGQLLETHWGWVAKQRGEPVIAPPFTGAGDWERLQSVLKQYGMSDGKAEVSWENDAGEKCCVRVVVGYQYLVKLNHCAADKLHVRGQGKRTSVTRQPPKGKQHEGGQRVGEMEVWALQAHQATENLRELLTVKSDVVQFIHGTANKERTLVELSDEAILDTSSFVKATGEGFPESLRALLLYFRAMGIDARLLEGEVDGQEREINIDEPKTTYDPSKLLRLESAVATDEQVQRWAGGKQVKEISYIETRGSPGE